MQRDRRVLKHREGEKGKYVRLLPDVKVSTAWWEKSKKKKRKTFSGCPAIREKASLQGEALPFWAIIQP